MKLKSKLIATIVSMCAAIAVMGVGVWASSSQSFQITVKNDIDVKIISVDADVYGEFAVYSQFSGHTVEKQTNAYAQAYHHTVTGTNQFLDRDNMDHGYLLYSSTLGGYNDGKGNSDADFEEGVDKWYDRNAKAEPTSGYYKYANEAKEGVYFATAESDGISDSEWKNEDPEEAGKGNGWASDAYNVDFNTRTAQITYMYTIRQWKKASANAATNEIDLLLQSSISKTGDPDIDNDLNYDADKTADNLNDAIYNAAGTAGIFIDAYITNASETEALGKGNAANNPAAGAPNVTGETADTLKWRKMDLRSIYSLPESEENETYYIVLTYTFARTGANLDLSGLQNAVEHSFVLAPPDKLADTGFVASEDYTAISYETITDDKCRMLCYATGLYDSNSETQYDKGHGYQIYGEEFVPKFSPAQISKSLTATQLASCFALYDTANVTTFTKKYSEADSKYAEHEAYQLQNGKNVSNHSNILLFTVGDGRQGTVETPVNPSTVDRAGYIFETPLADSNTVAVTGDVDGNSTAYYPDLTTGSTGWAVREFNEGRPVQVPTHQDTLNDAIDTQTPRS